MNMSATLITDLVVAAILVLAVVQGARKGFIKTIAGLIIVILAIIGARFLSSVITEPIYSFVYPMVEETITEKIDLDIIDPSGIDMVDKAIEEASGTVVSTVEVAAQAFVRSIVRAAAFLFCFVVLSIVLRLLLDAVDKVFDLPILKSVNGILGAVFGLLQVALTLFLIPYVAKHLGINLFDELSEGTVLLKFFVNNSPFDLIQLFINK